MKNIVLILVLLQFLNIKINAQNSSGSIFDYIKNSKVPSFDILINDSVHFSNNDLPVGKPIVIIYFSTECNHCKAKAKLLNERIDSVRDAFFLWASYSPLDSIRKFSEKFGLDKFTNVRIGRDEHYFFPSYYKTTITPYIVIYNRKGRFSREFRYGAKFHDIIEAINNDL